MNFSKARTDVEVDVGACIARLPANAAVKGIFFNDVLRRAAGAMATVDLLREAGVEPKRYLPFLDYSYADWMRIAAVAARALSPHETPAAGLRELGRHAYDAFLGTQVGRVLFGVLDLDVGAVLRTGPRAYRVAVNFGQIDSEPVNDNCVRYRFRDFPAFIDTYQVGVLEGVLKHCNARGEVLIAVQDIANADMEVSFERDAQRP